MSTIKEYRVSTLKQNMTNKKKIPISKKFVFRYTYINRNERNSLNRFKPMYKSGSQ